MPMYAMTVSSEQARAIDKAVELLLRLKIGQFDVLPLDPLTGFLMAFFKKACGNKGNYNNALKKIVPGYGKEEDKGK
jgi:hypothetical protein